MTEPFPTGAMKTHKNSKAGKNGKSSPGKKAQPTVHQSLVSIDVRNLTAAAPSPRVVEELLARIAAELRRCGERPAATRSAALAAAPTAGSGGGRTGTDGGENLLKGCVLTGVTYEQVRDDDDDGDVRLVRVEHYTCPNGETYFLRT